MYLQRQVTKNRSLLGCKAVEDCGKLNNILKDIHYLHHHHHHRTMRAKQNICGLELAYEIPDLHVRRIASVWERDRFRYCCCTTISS